VLLYLFFLRHGANESSVLSPLPPMRGISTEIDEPFVYGCQDPRRAADAHPRMNGAFVMLARNSELEGVLYSIDSIERHFNRWFNYPYVFLNDEHFNASFKAAVINATSSPVQFGKVDKTMFGFPDWVDHSWAKEGIASQGDRAIMYGGLESYHHMCRFYSGYVLPTVSICPVFSDTGLTSQILLQTRLA
jgi:mannosyltransferase